MYKMRYIWKCEECEKTFKNVKQVEKHDLKYPNHKVHMIIFWD